MSLAPHFPFTGLWEPGNFMGLLELSETTRGTYWNNTWTSVVVRPNPMRSSLDSLSQPDTDKISHLPLIEFPSLDLAP